MHTAGRRVSTDDLHDQRCALLPPVLLQPPVRLHALCACRRSLCTWRLGFLPATSMTITVPSCPAPFLTSTDVRTPSPGARALHHPRAPSAALVSVRAPPVRLHQLLCPPTSMPPPPASFCKYDPTPSPRPLFLHSCCTELMPCSISLRLGYVAEMGCETWICRAQFRLEYHVVLM